MKPFYESDGSLRYELFFPMKTQKKYFPYEFSYNKNRYIEQLLVRDLRDFDDFYENIEKDKVAQNVVGLYTKEFNIKDCNFKILFKTD